MEELEESHSEFEQSIGRLFGVIASTEFDDLKEQSQKALKDYVVLYETDLFDELDSCQIECEKGRRDELSNKLRQVKSRLRSPRSENLSGVQYLNEVRRIYGMVYDCRVELLQLKSEELFREFL